MSFSHRLILYKNLFVLLTLLGSTTAHAHQMRPAIVTISFQQAVVKVLVQFNAEAVLSGIGAEHENTDDAPQAEVYRELRELPPEQLTEKFESFAATYSESLMLLFAGNPVDWEFQNIQVPDIGDPRLSRKSEVEYSAKIPPGAATAVWSYDQKYGDAVVNFVSSGQTEKSTYWLAKGQQSPEYRLHEKLVPRRWFDVAVDYTGLGYLHILPKGLDHILFVLGLFLLSKKFRPLLWQVTAFTVAHSITLALTVYGFISLSASIVEPLIALSIAYVGLENLLTKELKPWRVVIVFLFGLLHGMGFAGVLTELGLPESEFITALITFNVGVELGQLSVILLAFLAVFWLRNKEDLYRKLVIIPGSLSIAGMGLYWTWIRVI